MIGAIIGDMIGAPYEFDRSPKTKKFRLFSKKSQFTDDSVMTIAVAEALMNTIGKSDEEIKAALVESMQRWGRRYPDAGYGEKFYEWLRAEDPKPYGSFGNGSAMRVSSAGRLFNTLEETRHVARLTAEVTHNHSEGIKGAEATASVIFLARARHGSRIMSSPNSDTIFHVPVTRYDLNIIMWRPAGRQCRRLSQHFWKAWILKMLFVLPFLSAETATP